MMKKLFTLIAMAAMTMSVNAQVLIEFGGTAPGTIAVKGTTAEASVKIHNNTDEIPGLKLANGYTKGGNINENYILLSYEGGFKKGDIVTFAGATSIKEADAESKRGAATLFSGNEGEPPTKLFTSTDFINGRLVMDDPKTETFTLTEDAADLKIGREGNTAAYIVKLKVERPTTGINSITAKKNIGNDTRYNLVGQQVSKTFKGVVIKNGKKIIQK